MSEGLSHIEDTNFPSFTGDGHLEGNPSGNMAAENEYYIGKNMIENDLWKQGMELIDDYSIAEEDDIFVFKANNSPSYLGQKRSPSSGPPYTKIEFVLRSYLEGNLYLPKSKIPQPIQR